MRHRESLVELASVHVQHMHKALDQMNLQIHHVISDITGVTGLAIVDAIANGQTDPQQLAALRDYRIKASEKIVTKSLVGTYRREHIFTLRQSRTAYRHYQQLISDCDREIQQRIEAFDPNNSGSSHSANSNDSAVSNPKDFDLKTHLERIYGVDLTAIPGFQCLRVQTLLSELGANLSKFPTIDSFSCWLNLCPKDGFSAGRRIRIPKNNTKNRAAQVFRLAATTLQNSQSYLGDYYRSQRARHGAPKAIKNTAHKLARLFYRLVTTHQPYDQSVFLKLEQRNQQRRVRKLQSLAKQMGYNLVPTHS
jgi:hypothetical protein